MPAHPAPSCSCTSRRCAIAPFPRSPTAATCTYLFGTSTFLSYYAKHANPLDFHSVRRVISGGEKLGDDVARVWQEKFGLRIYQGYGATECAPVIALSHAAVLQARHRGAAAARHSTIASSASTASSAAACCT